MLPSPVGASGILVYPVGSTQSALRPNERRSHARLTTSSIVLVHLGPDNGGIVINLSVDGVACQAAMRLALKPNTTLNVRLRGSGLNLEAVGELVWIGATQKEVGIRFKDLPAKQRQDIADWIERERKPRAASSLFEPSPLKPMPAMPGIASGDKSIPHSLSAALGMSQQNPEDPLASLSADEDDAGLSELLDSERGISPAAPRLEVVPPVRGKQDFQRGLENRAGSVDSFEMTAAILGHPNKVSDLPAAPETAPALAGAPPPELSPAEATATEDLPAVAPPVKAPAEEPEPLAPAADTVSAPLAAPSVAAAESNHAVETPSPTPATLTPSRSFQGNVAEKWIPPALLAAWRGGTGQHRLLLSAAAVIGLGFFALILVLAVLHAPARLGNPSAGESSLPAASPQPTVQPSATGLAAPGVGRDPVQAAPTEQVQQVPAAAPVAASRRSPAPQPSPFASFAKSMGFGSDDDPTPQIDENQLRVQVWTSQSNGYYYCTDDPYYKTVSPGSFMSQGDALQSGYRPILGQFCD
jgi:PilZ domain-containing protein